MKDKKYIVGLALVTISFIACVISYYSIYFAFPVFIIGIIFVFFSTQSLRRKLLTTLLPLTLCLPTMYLFLTIYNYTSPKIFLIPASYEGKLRIVYEEDCGIEPRKENGKQLLEFPRNGLLILKNKFDDGVNHEYFLLKKNGPRVKANQIIFYADRIKKLPALLVCGSGTLGGNDTQKGIMYSDFYLYNRDTTDVENTIYENNLNKLTDSLVNECRLKNNHE